MKYVKHVSLLFVLFACIAMSSSVVAETYTALGSVSIAEGNVPFSPNDTVEITVEYEKGERPQCTYGETKECILVTAFSFTFFTTDGPATIGLPNFKRIDLYTNMNYVDESMPGQEVLVVRVHAYAVDEDEYGNISWEFGEFGEYKIREMIMHFDKGVPSGIFKLVFENTDDVVKGSITGGNIFDYPASPVPEYICLDFEAPLAKGAVRVKKNRVIPVKAQLFDDEAWLLTDMDLEYPPVIQVNYQSAANLTPEDVTGSTYPAGAGTDGNIFEYDSVDGVWQFNLKTKNFSAPGTYEITMKSGDEDEYVIDSCDASFVIK